MEHAILGCLVRRRQAAVVLVTHSEAALASADEVILLGEGGVIERRGPPASLGFHRDAHDVPPPVPVSMAASLRPAEADPKPAAVTDTKEPPAAAKQEKVTAKQEKGQGKPGLVLPEDRELGMVRLATWLNYVRSAGRGRVLLVWLLLLSAQAALMAADYSLASVVRGDTLELYSALCGAASIFAVLRAVLFFATTLNASTTLHGRALSGVFAAPMWWFNANPIGRILNRFTGDLNNADEQLATAL